MENKRSCYICKNLISHQPDVICYVECSIRNNIDYTFSGSPNPETVAKDCEFFEEDYL